MKDKIILLGKGLRSSGWDEVMSILNDLNISYEIKYTYDAIQGPYSLGILINYNRIVPNEYLKTAQFGFVVFHSSDLPIGRGFAPIYYTLTQRLPLVQTLCFASEKVDAGNIIAKARYNLVGNETEEEVRAIDDQLTLFMLKDSIELLSQGKIYGKPQNHEKATWWPKRRPKDSKVDPQKSIFDLFDHVRALPSDGPAFFEIKGRRFYLNLVPEGPAPQFDTQRLTIEKHYEST